jgi:GNAT superfamily N-acetyltransferase
MMELVGGKPRKDRRAILNFIVQDGVRKGYFSFRREIKNAVVGDLKKVLLLFNAWDMFEGIPEDLPINFFWLNELLVYEDYHRTGVARQALDLFYDMLPNNSVVAGHIYPIANVELAELEVFYKRVGFWVVPCDNLRLLLTFVKNK